MPKYVKPNGKEIEIHSDSVAYAESMGWEPAKEAVKPAPVSKPATKAKAKAKAKATKKGD